MKWLEAFINWTAWEMTKPASYGAFHLIFTFVGVAVCILAAHLLRNVSEKGNKAVLLSTGIFLIITEVYKQLFYYYHIGEGTYQWWIFPFQLCSIPMYLCIIAPLLKGGRLQSGMYNFLTTFNLLGGLIAFVEPSGLIHGYWTLTLHAFIWHMLLIFVGFYLIASGRSAKTKKDFIHAIYTFLALCVIAFCINLIFWNPSEGSINMFYVGPRYSPLIVFKYISQNFGWYVSTLIYIPAVCLGAYLIYLIQRFFWKISQKKRQVISSEYKKD